MFRKWFNFLAQPIHLATLNAILIVAGIFTNVYYQVFCIPVTWSIFVLGICFLNTILFPIVRNKMTHFISGISFCVFLYCILFLAWLNLWSLAIILAFGIGLIAYVPHFLLIQTLKKNYDTRKKKINRSFLLGTILSISLALGSHYFYRKSFQDVVNFENGKYTHLEKNYFTERILGTGIIYHTNICVYDGWRPPKHDPIYVFNLWLTKFKNPLVGLSLEKRLLYYKRFFPDRKYKFDCSCANEGSWNYHNDNLWK
jgi:hypothetical protein